MRTLARQAAREAKGDPTELVLALDRHVRDQVGDFESFPLSVVRNDDLLVSVTAPYMAFRRSVIDLLRTGRAVDQAVWTGTVDVSIEPRRLGAPDIQTVILERNGASVPPVSTALRPMTFSNGAGDEKVLHAGEVRFSPPAFEPGGNVVLTLSPRDGAPIVYRFAEAELATLR